MAKLNVLVGAIALATAGSTWATNGYFLPGYGFRSQGMGGVGIAYGRDSLSTAANPANAVNTGMRGDLGFGIFNPERHAAVGSGTGLPGGVTDPAPGGAGLIGFFGKTESDLKYFIMPEMGFSMPLDDRLHVALAVVGNGGMNTSYPQNFFSFPGAGLGSPPSDTKIGVDMMQLLIPISLAYKVNDNHSVGVSLVLAETRFRAYGLEAFANFPGVPSNPDFVTGNGFDYSYGGGIRLGWLGEFMDDKLTVGLTYASRTWMTPFDKYKSLFAEGGDFDIPENYGIGIAIKPVKNLVIAADVVRINYNDVASVGNPGPSWTTGGLGTGGIPSLSDPTKRLGLDNGMGFGWENQTVYKLGIQYGVNNRLQVRAGYNYGKTPIPDDQVTFNLLAPATVERHYSVGFTYKANDNLEVTGAYMYAASNSQSACDQNIVDCASFNMHQNLFALSLGWVLDPGPRALDEYGTDSWEGINFDGWYGGLNFGQSNYRGVDEDSVDSRSEAWKVYGGYQFNKYLSVEGGYVNLNDMKARTGSIVTNMATQAWTLGVVASYPVTKKFSVMGKLGAAYMDADVTVKNGAALTVRSSDDGYEPNYGVGVSYALLDNLSVRAEWERFDRKEYDIDLVSAGFAMKF